MQRAWPPGYESCQICLLSSDFSFASSISPLPSLNHSTRPIPFQLCCESVLTSPLSNATPTTIACGVLPVPVLAPMAMIFPSGDHDGPPPENCSLTGRLASILRSPLPSVLTTTNCDPPGSPVKLTKANCLPSGENVIGVSACARIFFAVPPNTGI